MLRSPKARMLKMITSGRSVPDLKKMMKYVKFYVYEDKKGHIWTSGKNANRKWALSRYDEKSSSNKKPTVIEITQSLNLFGILEANDGSIWFGSFDGVYR
jgi:hypothetical protein